MPKTKADYTSEYYLKKAVERFHAKHTVETTGCWLWTAAKSYPMPKRYPELTYGKFSFAGKMGDYAHRVSYKLFKGSIPPGCNIDHLCRNTMCVNPEHLEAVTYAENVRRAPKHIVHGDERAPGRPFNQ